MLPDLAIQVVPLFRVQPPSASTITRANTSARPLLIASYTLLLNHVFEQPVQPKSQGFNFSIIHNSGAKVQKHLMNFLVQKPGFYCVKKVENWLAE